MNYTSLLTLRLEQELPEDIKEVLYKSAEVLRDDLTDASVVVKNAQSMRIYRIEDYEDILSSDKNKDIKSEVLFSSNDAIVLNRFTATENKLTLFLSNIKKMPNDKKSILFREISKEAYEDAFGSASEEELQLSHVEVKLINTISTNAVIKKYKSKTSVLVYYVA